MRLAVFIRKNRERILEEWDRFASELASAPDEMNAAALRDHAASMLDFIAEVLESPAQREQVQDKLRELGRVASDESAAALHGDDRVSWGFSVRDMVAEFRALRATVIRLWGEEVSRLNSADLVAFGDAIDHALAESIDCYSSEKERQMRLLEGMLAYSSDQSAIFDRQGRILYANRALAGMYGKHPRELAGKPVEILEPEFAAEIRRQVSHVWKSGNECRGDFTLSMTNGEQHVIDFLFAPIPGSNGEVEAVTVNSRDITERRKMENTLWQHANYDHLTGVPNRRLFLDRLEQDIRLVRRSAGLLAALYVDLDKFKQANDHLGHDGGDMLLRQSAQRIQSCVRETDTVARIGGDEFIVLLVDVGDRQHIEAVARAIIARLGRPFHIDDETVVIGASIGIAVYPDDDQTGAELLSHADYAMYVAKQNGGDRFHFHSTEDSRQQQRAREAVRQLHRDTRH